MGTIKYLIIITYTIITFFNGICYAQQHNLLINKFEQDNNILMPRHGMHKDQVLAHYKQPNQEQGPIGSPSIYVWTYDNFTVYFEDNYVINSVRHQAKIIDNTAETPIM